MVELGGIEPPTSCVPHKPSYHCTCPILSLSVCFRGARRLREYFCLHSVYISKSQKVRLASI